MNDNMLRAYRRWVLGAGIFNTIAAFPLSMPFLYRYYYALINSLNQALGFGGEEIRPPTDAVNQLFVNTAGLALLLIGILLLYTATDLKNRMALPFLNGIGRLVFSGLLVYYLFTAELARILILLALIDTVIASAFTYYYIRLRRSGEQP